MRPLSYTERMWRERIRGYLFPGAAERDEGFRREIERSSLAGLRVIGGLQIGMSLFLLGARVLVLPEAPELSLRLRQGGLIIGLGVVDWLLSEFSVMARWARLIGMISAVLVACVGIWASMVISARSTNPNDFIPGLMTLVMLIAVTTIPLRPMQPLLVGHSILSSSCSLALTLPLVSALAASSITISGVWAYCQKCAMKVPFTGEEYNLSCPLLLSDWVYCFWLLSLPG